MKKKKMRVSKGHFSISAVAKMFSVHQQTIRLYEKQGLISPKRSEGNTRLFSDQDIDRLEEVVYLTHQLGINLAGVEMILKLKSQIKKLQKNMNDAFDKTKNELDKESRTAQLVIKKSSVRLQQFHKDDSISKHPKNSETSPSNEAWEIIEYETE